MKFLKMQQKNIIMNTKLNKPIPENTKGILYLCKFSRNPLQLQVVSEILFNDAFNALNSYANIPNPESQLVIGDSYDKLISELSKLHANMENEQWLENLNDMI